MSKDINDTSISTTDAESRLYGGGGIELRCGTFAVKITVEAFAEACKVVAEDSAEDLPFLLASVENTIAEAMPHVNDAMTWKAKKRKIFFDNLVNDLKLRDAVKLRMAN